MKRPSRKNVGGAKKKSKQEAPTQILVTFDPSFSNFFNGEIVGEASEDKEDTDETEGCRRGR
jgi:hypothetical protein